MTPVSVQGQSEIRVTWLPSPDVAEGFVLIVFWHPDSLWTKDAVYNARRLLND